MKSIHKKLWRELWQMRSQALAIALVIMGGVSVGMMSVTTYDSLVTTRDNFYQAYRFADVFASLKRAPRQLLGRIAEIPGVRSYDDRVVATLRMNLPGFSDPISGLLQSLPDYGVSRLNKIHLVRGRLPVGGGEVLVSDGFADAHDLPLDTRLDAVINGKAQVLRVVGVALSPEHIYQIAPGAVLPDYKRFGVLWMAREGVAKAFDMDGAFNDIVLKLNPGVNPQDVIQQLDLLLKPYGGAGAYSREDQLSNRYLKEEFTALRAMAVMFPAIFLGVAMFLLNVSINRVIATQRELIGVLKAFGYTHAEVALHYAQMVMVISLLGVIAGVSLGAWLGQEMTQLYTEYYRFPKLLYHVDPRVVVVAVVGTLLVSFLGSLRSFSRVANLPPAEAMRPEPPASFRTTLMERLGLQRWLSQPARMIMRNIERRPIKFLISMLGVAAACAIMMVGNFQEDSVSFMMHVQFKMAQKEDLSVSFIEPRNASALSTLRAIEGVKYVEGQRHVPVIFHNKQFSYRGALQGFPEEGHLAEVLNKDLQPLQMPKKGVLLSEQLAETLHVNVGDQLFVQVLDGKRQTFTIPVTAMAEQYLGVGAYVAQHELNRLLGETDALSNALLTIDANKRRDVYAELADMPGVAGVGVRRAIIESFRHMLEEVMLTFSFINSLLGGIIAFGVVYNTVRIALSERQRELASLRVLGYTQAEVAYILLGEIAILVLLGTPLGFAGGVGLCALMAEGIKSDLYTVPLVLEPRTYASAALVVLISALVSAWFAWRRIRRLDLVEVLKTRE